MKLRLLWAIVMTAATLGAQSNAELQEQVRATERAFAKTMADRDHAAFISYLAPEAVFFNANGALRGAKQVGDGWKRMYDAAKTPFSWEPEQVEVLESGTLALSSGPVYDPDHKRIGTFNSVWRREVGGKWKIVFDKGCPPCNCGQ
ncbi:MAG TPA: nuclear transport factor 2 family protein [Candidatus Acidoferrum sp.]|nr:nuclear transport factor 2 family protein [Candidatus Acidoferrum sp.]